MTPRPELHLKVRTGQPCPLRRFQVGDLLLPWKRVDDTSITWETRAFIRRYGKPVCVVAKYRNATLKGVEFPGVTIYDKKGDAVIWDELEIYLYGDQLVGLLSSWIGSRYAAVLFQPDPLPVPKTNTNEP